MFKIPDFSFAPRLYRLVWTNCVIRSRFAYTCIGDSTGDLRRFDMTVRCAAHYAGATLIGKGPSYYQWNVILVR